MPLPRKACKTPLDKKEVGGFNTEDTPRQN